MRRNFIFLSIINFVWLSSAAFSQSFRIVPLGVKGGIDESNLSAYMVAAGGTNNYICLDAGTLYYGIEKAVNNKVFSIPAEHVLRQYIKGYFISHAHLDHVSGLIICSPADSSKTIYGLKSCLETIKTHYFTWDSWANFADEGERPTLKKYNYQVLTPNTVVNVKNTWMQVTAFPLSHFNLTSTAFLVKSNDAYILYLGDTGPDEVEHSHSLHDLWQSVAPLIKSKKLKAIMIETSFPNEQPDKNLFGHLTPHWLMAELNDLANLTGHNELKGFNIIITHVKPPQADIDKIKAQLKAENSLHLNLIFPEQGKAIDL
jgi:cAMP phosphodiesterase